MYIKLTGMFSTLVTGSIFSTLPNPTSGIHNEQLTWTQFLPLLINARIQHVNIEYDANNNNSNNNNINNNDNDDDNGNNNNIINNIQHKGLIKGMDTIVKNKSSLFRYSVVFIKSLIF